MSDGTTLGAIGVILGLLALAATGMLYYNAQGVDLSEIEQSIQQNKEAIIVNMDGLLSLDRDRQVIMQEFNNIDRNLLNGDYIDDIDSIDDEMRDVLNCLEDEDNYDDFQDCVDDL